MTKIATLRLVLGLLLAAAIIAAAVWLFGTQEGNQYLDPKNIHHLGRRFRDWVQGHPLSAPAAYVALYILLGILALPVWWLQIIAGRGFGLWIALALTQLAATVAAALAVAISHYLVGDWLRVELASRRARLMELDEKLGHHGLLVVMAVRLVHVMPFSLSNYAFGLTQIRPRQAALGTLLGNVPTAAFYISIGAGVHPWRNWHFMLALAVVNAILIIPLALRYYRPQWFKKLGIE